MTPLLYRDLVTFGAVSYGRSARGGAAPAAVAYGPALAACVGPPAPTAPLPGEAAESRPIAGTHYRILLQDDPSTGLPRRLAPNDQAICQLRRVDGTFESAFLVQIEGPEPFQAPLWCVEGDRVGNAAVDVPVQVGSLLLLTGGNLQLMTGGDLTFVGPS